MATSNESDGTFTPKSKFRILNNALSKITAKYISSISKQNEISVNLKGLVSCDKNDFDNIMQQFCEQLREHIDIEVSEILDDAILKDKLSSLDTILRESKNDKNYTAWRPSGIAKIDLQDHKWEVIAQGNEELKALAECLKEENDKLEKDLQQNDIKLRDQYANLENEGNVLKEGIFQYCD